MNKEVVYIGKESKFQETVAGILDRMGVLWFHPPNGGTRIKREAIALKRQGTKAGVSDVIILEPRGGYHGLIIELKTKTNKPTAQQYEFMNKAHQKGYKVAWTNSLDGFMKIVEDYFKMRDILPENDTILDKWIAWLVRRVPKLRTKSNLVWIEQALEGYAEDKNKSK